jgi:hypothetical protein
VVELSEFTHFPRLDTIKPMEQLLCEVAAHGWSAKSREEFVKQYDREIGETLIDLLVEYGLLTNRRTLRSLKSYVESRLQDKRAGQEYSLWEIVEEVYMRVYSEVFQKKLVENYVEGVRASTIKADFVSYLRGAVRRRLLDVLGDGELSEKELLDAILESKKPNTIRQHIAKAKGRYWEKVRSYLLCSRASTEKLGRQIEQHLPAITDYFFERFIAETYPAVRSKLKQGESALLKLLDVFVTAHYTEGSLSDQIIHYRGQVPRSLLYSRRLISITEMNSDSEHDEEALERAGAQARTKDPAQPERLCWWDRLLRCCLPTPSEISELQRLLLGLEGDAQRDTRLCLACVQLKAESPPEHKDDLRMFLVYYLSNYGTRPDPATQKESLTREALCLETIRGRALSWEQIFQLFGHQCNPTRVKSWIREKFENLTQGGTP